MAQRIDGDVLGKNTASTAERQAACSTDGSIGVIAPRKQNVLGPRQAPITA